MVVAVDKKALGKVERELARAGLIGIERLEVVLQENYSELP